MKSLYTLNNIHDFLTKYFYNCEWNYEIYDPIIGRKKLFTSEDVSKYMGSLLQIVLIDNNKNEELLGVKISNFDFELYRYESRCCTDSAWEPSIKLTEQWRTFLIDEYGDKYKNLLLRYIDEEEPFPSENGINKPNIFGDANEIQDVFSNE